MYWHPFFQVVSCFSRFINHDKIFKTFMSPSAFYLVLSLCFPATLKGLLQESCPGASVQMIWAWEFFLLRKRHENCSAVQRLFCNNFPLPQQQLASSNGGLASWLSDSGPLDFLVCCISRRDIKRSSYNKKQTLITSVMEIFSHISREAVRRGCIHFKLRLGMAICAKDNLTQEMEI